MYDLKNKQSIIYKTLQKELAFAKLRQNAYNFLIILFCDKLIKMVNFKLGNEMWRWFNQHDTSVGQRKILSTRQESNPWPTEHRAGALSTHLLSAEPKWIQRGFADLFVLSLSAGIKEMVSKTVKKNVFSKLAL